VDEEWKKQKENCKKKEKMEKSLVFFCALSRMEANKLAAPAAARADMSDDEYREIVRRP
jgi:hypothetical protein